MDTEQVQKTSIWKNKKFLYGVGIFIAVALVVDALDGDTPSAPVDTPVVDAPVQKAEESKPIQEDDVQSKEAAQKELDEVMKLAKTAGLVSSYEFSEKANVVYVGNVWYTQTVAFKKDFMGKVATLKKTITGYHRFEVLDAYSNEKVAEVTGFSGSLEVYK